MVNAKSARATRSMSRDVSPTDSLHIMGLTEHMDTNHVDQVVAFIDPPNTVGLRRKYTKWNSDDGGIELAYCGEVYEKPS